MHCRLPYLFGQQTPLQYFDISLCAMHANLLPIFYQPSRILHSDDCRQAIFACDHCSVGHQSADFGDQAFMDTNNGVQPGSVKEVTNISPSSRSAFSMFKMTRALPSITPEETGRPAIALGGKFSRLYALVMISPSDVITRGGVSFSYNLYSSFRLLMIWLSIFLCVRLREALQK